MVATKQDTSLAIAPRNSSDHASSASGNHTLAPAATAKQKLKKITSKYKRSVMTVPQNRGPKTGSPTSPTSKMM